MPDNFLKKDNEKFVEKSPHGSRMIPLEQYNPYEWKKCSIPDCQRKVPIASPNICDNCMQAFPQYPKDIIENSQLLNNIGLDLSEATHNTTINNIREELGVTQNNIAFKIIEQLAENRQKTEEIITQKNGPLKEISELSQYSKVCIIKGCNKPPLETDGFIYSFCSRNCGKKAAFK